MNKKSMVAGVVIIVLVAGGAFYAGTQYQRSQRPQFGNQAYGAGMRGGAPGQGFLGRMGGAVTGSILSVDDGGFTVKLADGGSKIVHTASSTAVTKSTTGSTADLTPGTQVLVTGPANADGSVTASEVRIGSPR